MADAEHPHAATGTATQAGRARDDDDEQAVSVSPDELRRAEQALAGGHTDVATLSGFEPQELEALYASALELWRLGLIDRAAAEFMALIALKPTDARFVRGLGLCYHAERAWGWAATTFAWALARDADDGVSMVLLAECLIYLQGKDVAAEALRKALVRGARRPHEQPYIQRAQALLGAIRL